MVQSRDRLFAPMLAAAAGALTTGLFFHPHFTLPIAHYSQIFQAMHQRVQARQTPDGDHTDSDSDQGDDHAADDIDEVTLGLGGLLLGILGTIGGHLTLFKGLDEMQQLAFRIIRGGQRLAEGQLLHLIQPLKQR
jgi:hypothetical protein